MRCVIYKRNFAFAMVSATLNHDFASKNPMGLFSSADLSDRARSGGGRGGFSSCRMSMLERAR